MSIDHTIGLDPDFLAIVQAVIADLAQQGYDFRVIQGVRSPADQAKLYRQSRSADQVAAAIADLIDKGAPWLASVLDGVGPQPDPNDPNGSTAWATNALPGAGWHQWGSAADLGLFDGTGAYIGDSPLYKSALAATAVAHGLTAGALWKHPDDDHIQMRPEGGATDVYSWPEIDAAMKAKFATQGN